MFAKVIITLLTARMFVHLDEMGTFVVELPSKMPPTITKTFTGLIPNVLAVFVFKITNLLFEGVAGNRFLGS